MHRLVAAGRSRLTRPTGPARRLHLTPRETDHLLLHNAGRLAQHRLARGLKLNVVESRALIAMQMMELIRNGSQRTVGDVQRDGRIATLMSIGCQLLGRNQVMAHVPQLVREVQIEATFPDGTKLLTIHDPIGNEDGNLGLALEGSFLPVPDLSVFKTSAEDVEEEDSMCPGQVLVSHSLGDIEINKPVDLTPQEGHSLLPHLIEIPVTNTGDRPIQ